MNARVNIRGERMDMGPEPPERGGISAQMARMVDGFSRLVTQHLRLARLELSEEARGVGRDVAAVAAFVPFLLVGYLLVWLGISFLLGRWLGTVWGFVLAGAFNLAVGGVGLWRAARRLRARRPPLERSEEELKRSAALLAGAVEPGKGKELDHARR